MRVASEASVGDGIVVHLSNGDRIVGHVVAVTPFRDRSGRTNVVAETCHGRVSAVYEPGDWFTQSVDEDDLARRTLTEVARA